MQFRLLFNIHAIAHNFAYTLAMDPGTRNLSFESAMEKWVECNLKEDLKKFDF